MGEIVKVGADAPLEQITDVLVEDGVVMVDGLLDADLLARFNAELDPLVEQAPPAGQGFMNDAVAWFFGDRTRHVAGIAGKSRVFATEVLAHPIYQAVCDVVLRPNCSSYQLNLAHLLERGPGSDQQMLHRDQDLWVHLPRPRPELQLASLLALTDFTADNGATRIVPGSHRWEPDRVPTSDEIVAAEMSAGSAVIYLGSTVHAGGANITAKERRRGMHISYCLGWLRTEENHYLATPLDVARELPRRSQELLGFSAHDAIELGGGYLGSVELQDPVELIASGKL